MKLQKLAGALVLLTFFSSQTSFAADQVLITEFMAANDGVIADEDGDFSDWIEIHNAGTNAVDLGGWYLTDRANLLTEWSFPSTNLFPNGYLVVFASGKNRRVPGAPLHTNFKLSNAGEFLALVRPDGTNIVSSFAPTFPPQIPGVSYGVPVTRLSTNLIASGSTAQVLIPTDDSLGLGWIGTTFDDSSWLSLPLGVGYETDLQLPFVPALLADSVADFSGVQGQNNWYYGYWSVRTDPDGHYSPADFTPFPNGGGDFSANNFWTGSIWDWFQGDPPFTQLTSQGGMPSAGDLDFSRPTHWAVRRYSNTFDGPLTISGTITHTSGWVHVVQTGVASSSLIYIYHTGAGEGYVDDMSLVVGSSAGVGQNLLVNGDFENATLAPWTLSPNLFGSTLSSDFHHSGSQSLHVVSSAAGTTQTSSIWQLFSPTLILGQTYTLSYWYLPVTNSASLVVRTSGSWINTTPAYCGDGVVVRVYVDGQTVLERAAQVSSEEYRVNVPAHLGSIIDFAIDPGSADDDYCDATIFTARVESGDPTLVVVADSAADWSLTGTQGENHWYYGYYNATADTAPPYGAQDFVPFPRALGPGSTNNFWTGREWKWFTTGGQPFDEIGQYVMGPNGLNSGDQHWVIRRWISEVSGTVAVDWTFVKQLADGAGCTVRILHNGHLEDSYLSPAVNSSAVKHSVTINNVQIGDSIDIALDPLGTGDAAGDAGDRSLLSAVIRGHPSLLADIRSDIQAFMQYQNASAYVRIPFTITDPASIQYLTLRMKYDDGFVAYLNGQQIAQGNAPDPLTWLSSALSARSDTDATRFEDIDLTAFTGSLKPGSNILAIHGLNASADDTDFLISAELVASSTTLDPSQHRYFPVPTPGADNGFGNTALGPLILSASHAPAIPKENEDLYVTASVLPSFNPIGSVHLLYRVMFGPEVDVPMVDDGLHADGVAGDGIFGAIIPASASTNGQMVRYYIYATDDTTNSARYPTFDDPRNAPEYQGTIVFDPGLTNPLPVLHMFVQDPIAATNYTGTRCSVFYEGEFYDNIFVNLHGQTTAYVFPKRSMNFNMNRGYKFRWDPNQARVTAFNLLTPISDKAFVRQILAYETFQNAGVPTHFAFGVRVQQNNSFFGVFQFVEKGDDNFLARVGLDPNGAFYKVYLPLTNGYSGVAEKKTRQNEPNDDLQALVEGISSSGDPLRQYVFDNFNVPEVVDFLATIQVVQNEDCCWYKNYYLYRDSDRTGEWQILPWDLDLVFGRTFAYYTNNGVVLNGYFSTNIFWMNAYFTQNPAIYDFIGTGFNAYPTIGDAIFKTPEAYQMFLRRWTSVQDRYLQPTNTHPLLNYFEHRVDQLAALHYPDAALDFAKWGNWFPTQNMAVGVQVLKSDYFARRRGWIFNTLRNTNTGPYLGSQPTNVVIGVGDLEINPTSGVQAHEYVQLTNANSIAVDISGWRLSGAVDFTFRGGTVIPSHSVVYVSPDVAAFRARPYGPRGGLGLFVVGPYQGQLSARGESLLLTDDRGRTVGGTNYTGHPSPAQQYLRITEIMYHPSAAAAGSPYTAEDFEYIELRNIGPAALDLRGVKLVNGVSFVFGVGNVTTNLAAGQRLVLVRNPAAFVARYGGTPVVGGTFAGTLNNGGETIRLEDAAGEVVLDFAYDNRWYPATDGLGFSLAIVDDTALYDTWGLAASWRPSGEILGSPGRSDPAPIVSASVVINEVLSHSTPPLFDAVELYNPSSAAADISGWYLSDDFLTPKKFRIPNGTVIAPGGYRSFDETAFNPTNPPTATAFSFSAGGDEAYLFAADANGNLTGYFHGFAFGAAENGVSFGRWVTSDGREQWPAQTRLTIGATNAGPKVGPVVIAEVEYHPPSGPDGLDNTDDEYVVIANSGATAAPLYHAQFPTNTWHLRGGISFDWPPAAALAPGGSAYVVSFDPTNVVRVSAFRRRFSLDSSVPIFGPFSGKLGNTADSVHLLAPEIPVAGVTPYFLVDAVEYTDAAPWPVAADGLGASLRRRSLNLFGNDPANWTAGTPALSDGGAGATAPLITVQPVSVTVAATLPTSLSVSASGSAPLRYQWRANGTNIYGATNAVLTLANPLLGDAGMYNVAVYNSAGSTVSSNATVNVVLGPFFLASPQSTNSRTGGTVVFTALAFGNSTPRYQWRFNGVNIAGATSTSLILTNVQATNAGTYTAVATDTVASVVSNPGVLTILFDPQVVQQPVGQPVLLGGNVTFSIAISNAATLPLGFRWRRNGFNIAGGFITQNEYTNYFTVTNVQLPFTNYNVVVTNIARTNGILSASANLTILVDTDGDGLPDDWELAHGMDPNDPSDAALDFDGDTMSNLNEYIAGTDPIDPASYLRVDAATGDGGVALTFGAVAGRTYSVLFTDNLNAPWTKVADVVARDADRSARVIDPAGHPNRFYRLVTPRQP